MGVADHVLEFLISGHLSRRMLEHYSHIRLKAKRDALDALDAHREQEDRDQKPAGSSRDSDPALASN